MNSLLLRNLGIPRTSSLQTFSEYREAEANSTGQSVTVDGALLEFQTLELRVHPPNVEVDNETYDDRTVVTVDSANRPGTLVECVQTLTELGLNVCRARISSDGGWFHDEFHVMDQPGQKVRRHRVASRAGMAAKRQPPPPVPATAVSRAARLLARTCFSFNILYKL